MKFIQRDGQVTISQYNATQLVVGIIFIIAGAGVCYLGVKTKPSDTNQNPHGLIIMGVIFALIGLALALLRRSQKTVITPGSTVAISSRRLIGAATQNSFPVATVRAVQINTDRPNGTNRRSSLQLVLQDGSTVYLGSRSASGINIEGIPLGGLGFQPLHDEGSVLANLLQVPLDAHDISTIGGMFDASKEVIAELQGQKPDGPGVIPTQSLEQIEAIAAKAGMPLPTSAKAAPPALAESPEDQTDSRSHNTTAGL